MRSQLSRPPYLLSVRRQSFEIENHFHYSPRVTRTLDSLAPGERAIVTGVLDGTPIDRRLEDLGLLAGTEVRALRRAPLGDPIVFELRGYQLCLRRSEARRVAIRDGAQAATAATP
jgi:Fe2+ transport system protein FeoA